MRLPPAAGALTVDGAVGVRTVEVSVGDAVVVAMRAAASGTTETADAVVFAELAESFDAATLLVGDAVAGDAISAEELVPDGRVSVVRSDESDVGFFVAGVESVVVVLPVEVLVVPVLVTEVLAPPDACTTPACGSVAEPD
ncbi:hypothetical protein [Mycobacterium sp. MMS18-G62]